MLLHPDLMLANFHAHERELIAEADRQRLLSAARRRRQAGAGRHAAKSPVARGRPDATLAPCGPHAAAPAR